MDSKRQEKFARLIQKDLGEIFQMVSHRYFNGAFITIREVKVTPDLGLARVYLSFFQVDDKEDMLEKVDMHAKEIRHELAQRIRHQVRKIPALEFFVDDTLDYAQHMEDVFKKLREEEGSKD
ncbi:MAG: 30S ribosome-binding factor RbfA [Bacteroidetes bacterium]|nr:30S ribosome-binding factor RbfA [Bacteroidota bacterium]